METIEPQEAKVNLTRESRNVMVGVEIVGIELDVETAELTEVTTISPAVNT